ncbi:MAG: hypothetical protein ACR2PT_14995 [Endozoicomonas sp.]
MTATIFSLSVLLAGCTAEESKSGYEPDKTYRFTILHTNDHHDSFWQNHDSQWDMSARKALIDDVRSKVEAEGGRVLLISGGDINTRASNQGHEHANSDLEEMNLLAYNAMAVGRHEFTNSIEVLRQQQELADFPFLSANIFSAETGHPLFDAYKLFNLDGLSLAIMGLTTDTRLNNGSHEFIRGIDIRSPVTSLESLVPKLHEQADIIIVTSNFWHCQDEHDRVLETSQHALPEIIEGVDIIVGGFSTASLPKRSKYKDTHILKTRDRGREIGRADFEFRNGELELVNYQLIPVNMD